MSHALSPEAVVQHHTEALIQEDIEAILEDYTDESVIITQGAIFRGFDELREFFKGVLNTVPEGFWDAYTVTREEVIGEIYYDEWEAHPWFPCGTDTLLIRDGKILVQTGATCVPAAEG